MDIRRLRHFIAVAEELNFTRAADRLHMAQPPLSMQIRLLEESLGVRLFVRDKRRVFLTPAGHELLARARAIQAAAEDAAQATRNAAAGLTGRLALGYTASAMFTERLPGVLRRYRAEHPSVDLLLQETTSVDQLHALHERTLDVGVLRRPDLVAPDGVALEPWYREPLVAALPKLHRLARKPAFRIAELRDEPLITYPRDAGIGLYWPILRLYAAAGATPRVIREAREPAVMIGLVAAGAGVAIVPFDTQRIRLEGVAYRRLLDVGAASTLCIAFRPRDGDGDVQRMLAALREVGDAPPAPLRRRRKSASS